MWSDAEIHAGYEHLNRRLLELASLEPHSEVVDVGCGPGTLLRLLSELGRRPKRAWAIDPDEDMRRSALQALGQSANVLDGDLNNFGALVPPHGVDAVLFGNCLHLAADPAAAIATASKVLRPGGTLALSTGFYERAIRNSERHLYASLVLRASREIRGSQAGGARPLRGGAPNLTSKSVFDAIAASGLKVRSHEEVTVEFDRALTVATIGTDMFARGVFPGADLASAKSALVAAADSLFNENEQRTLHRRYLLVTAQKPATKTQEKDP